MFYYFFRFIISLIAKLSLRCQVIGKGNMPQGRACIVVSNHINLLDSPILGVNLGRRVYFMAKEEIFHPRLMGWLAVQCGAISVTKGRLNRRAGRQALGLLAQDQAIVIYPEGRRSEDGKLGKAYPGVALLAVKQGVPIVPVGICGTSQLIGKWWFFKRPRITVTIGQPFVLSSSNDKPNNQEITRLTNEIMIRIAEILPPEYRGQYVN